MDFNTALCIACGFNGLKSIYFQRRFCGEAVLNVIIHKNYASFIPVERFFLRIKRFRKIFTRYNKLDIIFSGFILFAMVIDTIV